MNTSFDRRTFLRRSAYAAAGGAFAVGPMQGLVARAALGAPTTDGYGPLGPVADLATGEPLLWLPEGFHYRSFGRTGEVMSDGVATPPLHDGMAVFPTGRGTFRLVRNHELYPRGADRGHRPAFGDVSRAYDREGGGGTTTLEVDGRGHVVDSWVSLNGTIANCAGGPTPWGTWISGEESTNGDDQNRNFRGETLTLTRQHGYLFEVPAGTGGGNRRGRRPADLRSGEDWVADPAPIRSAGRFAHEAVAVDPRTSIIYQTQDRFAGPSGFYRYTPPNDPRADGSVADGGVLEILAVDGAPNADLSGHVEDGTTYPVRWVRIEDPDPDMTGLSDDDGGAVVFDEGASKGAAGFSRIEGCWYGDRKVFFASTQGGAPNFPKSGYGDGAGQVWMYDLDAETLTMIFESPGPHVLDMPDNLTVSPRGALLLCEDSSGDNFLRGLTRGGAAFDFALNRVPGHEQDEWAGACFAPGADTLFVNIQTPGITFAIWGPWRRGPL